MAITIPDMEKDFVQQNPMLVHIKNVWVVANDRDCICTHLVIERI